MPSDMSDAEAPRAERTGTTRLLQLGAVLLAEYLALSLAFDAQVVQKRGGVWEFFGRAGAVGPFLVAAAGAVLLLGPGLITSRLPKQRPIRVLPAVVHVATLAAFFGATHLLFAAPAPPGGPALLWLAAWCLLGLGSFVSLLLAGVGDLRWILQALSRTLVVGGALGLLAWGAGLLGAFLWEPLAGLTFRTVAWMLAATGADLDIDFETRVLGLEDFRVAVAPVCSGIEGLGLFLALMTGFLVQQRKVYRFPQALLVLPVGMLLIWLGNCVRIAVLMLVGAHVDADVAIGSFHSKAGWVFFCAITIGVAVLSRYTPWITRSEQADMRARTENPAAPWIVPLLGWIALSLALSALHNGHDPFYGLRVLAAAGLLWTYRRHYRQLLAWPSVTAWIAGTAVGVAWLALPTAAAPVPPLEGWSDAAYYLWLVARAIGAVLVIPIIEELAFRGYLMRFLTKREFLDVRLEDVPPLAILGSSLAFGALHERWELAALTGVVYAVLCRMRGRLIDGIAAHAASNAVIAVWVLVTQSWQHW